MKQKKIKLTRNMACKWSYEDEDFTKEWTTPIEVVSMLIARITETIQAIDDRNETAKIEIVVKRC